MHLFFLCSMHFAPVILLSTVSLYCFWSLYCKMCLPWKEHTLYKSINIISNKHFTNINETITQVPALVAFQSLDELNLKTKFTSVNFNFTFNRVSLVWDMFPPQAFLSRNLQLSLSQINSRNNVVESN